MDYAKLKKLQAKSDALIGDAADRFKGNISKVLKSLEKKIISLAEEYKTLNDLDAGAQLDLEFALWSRAQLQKALTEAGYYKAVGSLVEDYASVLTDIEERYAFFGHALELGSTDKAIIDNLMQFNIDTFYGFGKDTLDLVYQSIYRTTLSPTSFDNVLAAVSASLEGSPLQRYSYTYANDSLMQFSRSVSDKTAEATGWNDVMYVGPDDEATRPWCEDHVGKVYSIAKAKSMTNDSGTPAWIHGGGYNCRHSFIAVPPGTEAK